MRIAPRTLLCGTAWRENVSIAGAGFDELRDLAAAAGDKVSLAIGMAGLLQTQALHDRPASHRVWPRNTPDCSNPSVTRP